MGRWVGGWGAGVYSTVGKGLGRRLRGFNIFGFWWFEGLLIKFWFVFGVFGLG